MKDCLKKLDNRTKTNKCIQITPTNKLQHNVNNVAPLASLSSLAVVVAVFLDPV